MFEKLRNVTRHARCPYCHDALSDAERVACTGCGTPHHPVCLEELGGCTVLGCSATPPVAPKGPTEEIRARVRQRAASYLERVTRLPVDGKAARRRTSRQPHFCVACERELLVLKCPSCSRRLNTECSGDSVHCDSARCRSFYAKIAKVRGAPIRRQTFAEKLNRPLVVALALAVGLLTALAYLIGGPYSLPFVALVGALGIALFLFAPLFAMIFMARRGDD